ncbi:MAG TPA: hypothetical protein VGJ20_15220 [Xanthobacteraceae bacterium]
MQRYLILRRHPKIYTSAEILRQVVFDRALYPNSENVIPGFNAYRIAAATNFSGVPRAGGHRQERLLDR